MRWLFAPVPLGRIAAFRTLVYLFVAADLVVFTPWVRAHASTPGDLYQPRVARPGFGASDRFVVAPGQESTGLFNMPTSQSGHPLAPYYNLGHEAWMKGEPTQFLPGKTEHTLTLTP